MKWITIISCLILFACGESAKPSSDKAKGPIDAKTLFISKCALCHGHDGKQQYAGAKNLGESVLPLEEVVKIISEGKGNMPPHRGTLSSEEIQSLAAYVLTLRGH